MSAAELTEFGTEVTLAGSHFAYIHVPAADMRHAVDGLFPGLAKNAVADAASGFHHRWAAGHDLLMDVLPRFATQPVEALKHGGHVVLTDFPTKAGIPIPGFSQSGLGQWLVETAGISKGWLSMNIMDTGVGIFCIAEGAGDLRAAMAGELPMNAWTFFDTFGEGTIELIAGICTQNPALLISAAENYLAGIISTVSTFTYSVAPEVFFGASVTTALIGAGISYFLNRNKDVKPLAKEVLYTSWRGFTAGGLGAVSGYFAAGAFLGFACIQLGQLLAERDARHAILCCSCSAETYLVKLQIFGENPNFNKLWQAPQRALKSEFSTLKVEDYLHLADDVILRTDCPELKKSRTKLRSAEIVL